MLSNYTAAKLKSKPTPNVTAFSRFKNLAKANHFDASRIVERSNPGQCLNLTTPVPFPPHMALESERAPLESCFNYSDYNEAFRPNESEADNLHSDMECDDVDVDLEAVSEQEETYKRKGGPYRYYSEAQKQRFWQPVIEQRYSVYKAAQALNISLQAAYTWKRK
nr:hypothetical protein K4G61_g3562 [Candida parapsilosis]